MSAVTEGVANRNVLDDLARQALATFPNDWPAAEAWLRDRIVADDALFRQIATPLIAAAVHERITSYGRHERAQTTRDAIQAATALAAVGGDTNKLAKDLHATMSSTPWHPGAVKRAPSVLGLLGMGSDDMQALLDRYTLRRGKRLGDATEADLDDEIQMRRQQARGMMQPVRWLLLIKKRLASETMLVRDAIDNTTALQLLHEAERISETPAAKPARRRAANE